MTDISFESLLDREFRWPQKGDRLFVKSTDWSKNAHIQDHSHSRLIMMTEGYKRGADLMVMRSVDNPFDRDTLVFPIIFNYRQFIELSLKYLIAAYGSTVGVGPNWISHDLAVLWKTFSHLLGQYGHSYPNPDDLVVAGIIAEFAKVDPHSFAYRYPVDTKGNPIPVAHQDLDLSVLADVMQAVDGYFSGCDGYLDNLQGSEPGW